MVEPAIAGTAAPFAVDYVDRSALAGFFLRPERLLGVVGFGAAAPGGLPPDCPFVAAPLSATSGAGMFEIWTASEKLRPLRVGRVAGACNDAIAFGVITLDESGGLEAAAALGYSAIFDFLDESGHAAPIRFWNYPVAITEDENGMERYRRFNIGRHQALSARLREKLPPAATGVGGRSGNSVVYFLAARAPALPVENPRQVSAYDYPPLYGPRSPDFSRASIYTQGHASCLFVSGTASIVGHETRHAGDLAGQIGETANNLRALIAEADRVAAAPLRGEWALKIYGHDPADEARVAPVVDDVFGAGGQRLYLRGDICRRELLVEIEAFRQF